MSGSQRRAGELDVVKESITRYGAVDAIEKGDSLQKITDALQATLIYAEVKRLKKSQLILAARTMAQQGLKFIENISAGTKATFKKRFEDSLRELDALAIDEMSGLLNSGIIIDYARELLNGNDTWALGIIMLDGLASYEEEYGSFERIQAVKIVSAQLQKIVEVVMKNEKAHSGYIGDGRFILIAETTDSLNTVNNRLQEWFPGQSAALYSALKRTKSTSIVASLYSQR